ncbi:hypothetical protein GCM10007971_23060 [Oceanobacillus indicireducens]|uniref:Uncharacterized protein n=1 Tax=Oceanobacillus indicireducens TaxID=1004261 RepID=A0A917XZW2_9BACI|nr:hypothetical protein GCM10007971_23060 [Oceanobacillus indicireducens]
MTLIIESYADLETKAGFYGKSWFIISIVSPTEIWRFIENINFRKRGLENSWKVRKSKEFQCPPEYKGALVDIERIIEGEGEFYLI